MSHIISSPQDPTKVKVLMSFGAVNGGFELAWDIHNEIEKKLGKDSVYLDAISLKNTAGTEYNWDSNLGIYKMSNPDWNTFYEKAMKNSVCMIFLITNVWLESFYCWHEYEMLKKQIIDPIRPVIKPIFILFSEAITTINTKEIITVRNPDKSPQRIIKVDEYCEDLGKFFNFYDNKDHFEAVNSPRSAPGHVIVEGETYSYNYLYTLTGSEMDRLKIAVVSSTGERK